MRISKKILLGFSVILVSTAILNAINIVSIKNIGVRTEIHYTLHLPIMSTIARIRIAIDRIMRVTEEYTGDWITKEDYMGEIEICKKHMGIQLEHLFQTSNLFTHEETENIKDSINKFHDLSLKLSLLHGKSREEINPIMKEFDEKSEKLNRKLDIMFEKVDNASKKSRDSIINTTIASKGIILSVFLIVILIALVTILIISNSISKPLVKLMDAIVEIGMGKLDTQIDINSKDEIGDLAKSFNQMTKDLKHLQSQLIQSGKLAAIGELGSGVAHELNNPLTGILGYAQHILEKTKRTDFNADDFKACTRQMEYIEKEGQRCKNIVQGLLKFSRKSHDKFELLNVNNVIEDTLALVGHQLAMNNINIVKELVPDLKEIIGNANQLQQVFTNIILNAQQAMSDKGELRIMTRNDDNGIKIEFADTGCGIPKENLNRIFDPFFTTKKDWRGTGLGLSISYNIIHDHNGNISVQSESGKGTTFSITLPAKGETSHE